MFQEDLDNLHQWNLRSFMGFNAKKSKIMRITETAFYFKFLFRQLSFGGRQRIRDLGIITDQHLHWNLHIDKVVAKANRMLGLIKELVEILMVARL